MKVKQKISPAPKAALPTPVAPTTTLRKVEVSAGGDNIGMSPTHNGDCEAGTDMEETSGPDLSKSGLFGGPHTPGTPDSTDSGLFMSSAGKFFAPKIFVITAYNC
jgi:hypothetical protein